MGLWTRLIHGKGRSAEELAAWLGTDVHELLAFEQSYTTFTIPKRGGGQRRIQSPDRALKIMQKRILRRVLSGLTVHPAAIGFERGRSIVTNARVHAGRRIVVRMDVEEFFASTTAERVRRYFRRIGWNRPAARLLTKVCTFEDALPAGAPTSPRLSNLVNFRLDARLAGAAARAGAVYTRYADDLTFSFAEDDAPRCRELMRLAGLIAEDYGYRLHRRKKLHVRRAHQRQYVTGLVVNRRPNLPRETRRRLRAIEHRLATGRDATLTEHQMAGWRALQHMIETQSGPD
ncbi:MAG: RNA-directed DNA polymerase [Phycisphaerales bacterium]|nr:MAG: RNA-directed DNA polymerase [Phycisphaerales bacterium]